MLCYTDWLKDLYVNGITPAHLKRNRQLDVCVVKYNVRLRHQDDLQAIVIILFYQH